MKRILLCYDGSESAARAFEFALELSSRFGAALQVLSVARPPEMPEDVETEAEIERAREHFERDFVTLRERAQAAGIAPAFEVVVGHPAHRIVDYAEANGIDHIVLGHRGKTFFERWRLGSVSKQVIHYAHCTTTVVR
jgi:nucleotide-binding universal stress UspA family protein